MATIQKLERAKGPKYRVMIRRQGYRPVSKIFGKKKDAEEWARKIEGELEQVNDLPTGEARRHTLADAIDGFMLEYAGRDVALPGRLAWWRSQYGELRLAAFTQAKVQEGARKLSGSRTRNAPGEPEQKTKGRTPATLNRHLAAVSSVMEWAIAEKWITRNPTRGIRRTKESTGVVRWLRDEEREALLAAADASEWSHLGLLVRMALSTGARLGELMNLRWRDIDLNRGLAHLTETKSGRARALPLIAPVKAALGKLPRPIDGGLLFRDHRDPSRPFPMRRHWEAARTAAGLPDFRFHDLRHSCASYLAQNGATLLEIADVLGHETLAMVKRYAHLTTDHKARLVERVMAERVR